ncbi:MAG: hypothetical protein FRX48_07896 [Lasallia pustulata]|uniref:Uncharacterized protein n=1 Tax=Lasallia pustulata TaxID=136370 RepID=A0A5M8PHA4_9LECA|nr:MAG: hypothetical protein FRX48_07896 [Lasallia pustulata]
MRGQFAISYLDLPCFRTDFVHKRQVVHDATMPGIRQSTTKREFYRALALDDQNPVDNQRFEEMWKEAVNGWFKYLAHGDRTVLKLEHQADPNVKRPWKWEHLDGDAINAAITAIWAEAGDWPRYYYILGHVEDDRVYNWVLKWLLWHVCRHRDWRNRKLPAGPQASASDQVANTMPENIYYTTQENDYYTIEGLTPFTFPE